MSWLLCSFVDCVSMLLSPLYFLWMGSIPYFCEYRIFQYGQNTPFSFGLGLTICLMAKITIVSYLLIIHMYLLSGLTLTLTTIEWHNVLSNRYPKMLCHWLGARDLSCRVSNPPPLPPPLWKWHPYGWKSFNMLNYGNTWWRNDEAQVNLWVILEMYVFIVDSTSP